MCQLQRRRQRLFLDFSASAIAAAVVTLAAAIARIVADVALAVIHSPPLSARFLFSSTRARLRLRLLVRLRLCSRCNAGWQVVTHTVVLIATVEKAQRFACQCPQQPAIVSAATQREPLQRSTAREHKRR